MKNKDLEKMRTYKALCDKFSDLVGGHETFADSLLDEYASACDKLYGCDDFTRIATGEAE